MCALRALALFVAAVVAVACGDNLASGRGVDDGPATPGTERAPAVVVLIGDGMGQGQLDVASLYRHGATDRLFLQGLPARGELHTGGPSGLTDSAAAATVMATGVYTYNGAVGVDRQRAPVETLVERAAARGWATGVVTTTALPHATPAGFTAHVASRSELTAIADQQVRITRPTVMLGGGSQYFRAAGPGSVRADGGLEGELDAAGYTRVANADSLAAAVAAGAPRLFGAFTPEHMTFARARGPDSPEPTLAAMAEAALATLDRDPDGFFLMIEGGRIDHAGHANDLANTVGDTLAFDDTVAAVTAWARARGNVTVVVSADHETGGLEVVAPQPAGILPEVRWRWGQHTNARVLITGDGPGSEVVDGALVDHRWMYQLARARIDGAPFATPAREPIPDGELGDLRHRAATQIHPSSYGAGFNQLDALWLDASPDGLHVGVEGVFEWDANAVEVWIDVDPGADTGVRAATALADTSAGADQVLSAAGFTLPAGFGADLALVAVGGAETHIEELLALGGLRGLAPPYGEVTDLAWHHTAINYGDVRTRTTPLTARPGQGLEAVVPWSELYPGGVPVGATVALVVVLVNSDGGHTSNQVLPPLPPGAAVPGREPLQLSTSIRYTVADEAGLIDGAAAPTVVP